MSDLISRQAALDIAFKYCPDDDGTCSEARSERLKKMQAARKKKSEDKE